MARTGAKQFVVICVALIGLIGPPTGAAAANDDEAWSQFKQTHQKNYTSAAEEARRRQIFIENKNYIESHNTKQTQSSFTQGINQLTDLTPEEIITSRCGFRLGPNTTAHEEPIDGLLQTLLLTFNESISGAEHSRAWYDNLLGRDSSLDWRERGRVSRVKDQGSCGSCWAFATTGALESALAARNRYTLLSEQNLVDCSRRYGNNGCSGGLMDAALRYVRDHGIMSSADYPYRAKDGQCRFRRDKAVTRSRGSARIPAGNESMLRMAVALFGPIPVAIDASQRSFHSYKSGVYDERGCKSSPRALNHAVLLVGYGSDKAAGDYWLIKNSWGRSWGDNGYMKLARNRRNQCGIASYAVVPL